MKMTLKELRHLDHPVDKLMLVSLCSQSYQLYAEDQGIRFAIYHDNGHQVVSHSVEEGKDLIHGVKCKAAVLYQQLPYDEACAQVDVVHADRSPAMEIPLPLH